MATNGYQYALVLYRQDGSPLGEARVEVDWDAAKEWTEFLALRRGTLTAADVRGASAIEPVWHSTLGEPYVGGVLVRVYSPRGDIAHQFSTTYFRGLAQRASAHLVEAGQLQTGERFVYLTTAFPARDLEVGAPQVAFRFEEVVAPLPLVEAPLVELTRDAVPVG